MTTYEVTQEQFDLIRDAKESEFVLVNALDIHSEFVDTTTGEFQKALLRYIGGDETIEFKVKEKVYRLRGEDNFGRIVYFRQSSQGVPDWTFHRYDALTGPIETLNKYWTSFWEFEEVK